MFKGHYEGDDVGSRKDITTFFQEPLENNVMVNSLQMIGRSKSVLVPNTRNTLRSCRLTTSKLKFAATHRTSRLVSAASNEIILSGENSPRVKVVSMSVTNKRTFIPIFRLRIPWSGFFTKIKDVKNV